MAVRPSSADRGAASSTGGVPGPAGSCARPGGSPMSPAELAASLQRLAEHLASIEIGPDLDLRPTLIAIRAGRLFLEEAAKSRSVNKEVAASVGGFTAAMERVRAETSALSSNF